MKPNAFYRIINSLKCITIDVRFDVYRMVYTSDGAELYVRKLSIQTHLIYYVNQNISKKYNNSHFINEQTRLVVLIMLKMKVYQQRLIEEQR